MTGQFPAGAAAGPDAEQVNILDVALTADAPGDVPAPEPAAAAQSVESQQLSPVVPSKAGASSAREAAEPVGKPGPMAAFADLDDDDIGGGEEDQHRLSPRPETGRSAWAARMLCAGA
ncbi:hypothetical protein [Streptomyces sp. NPDC093149]|uniref:hypothetical protein n=1 Tax=Streptomyces sp. NPDC093149 TaxID=3366031 RepID=UPI003822FB8C